eukprot:15463893-Alexandrium_andersonii.AAC.1
MLAKAVQLGSSRRSGRTASSMLRHPSWHRLTLLVQPREACDRLGGGRGGGPLWQPDEHLHAHAENR